MNMIFLSLVLLFFTKECFSSDGQPQCEDCPRRFTHVIEKSWEWGPYHCEQIRKLRVRIGDLESFLENHKDDSADAAQERVDSILKTISNNIKEPISALIQENLNLKARLRKLEEIIGIDDEDE